MAEKYSASSSSCKLPATISNIRASEDVNDSSNGEAPIVAATVLKRGRQKEMIIDFL